MLITFKSKAAAEVLMYEVHAKPLLDLLNKDLKRGIITAAETGLAIARLEAEIAARRTPPAENDQDDNDLDSAEKEHRARSQVSLATRAFPLLEMLRAAQRDQQDVMWGV